MKLTIALAVLTLGVSAAWGQSGKALIQHEEQLNDQCRGGSGDNPATMAACAERDKVLSQLQAAGVCYGHEGQFEYQKDWVPCDVTAPKDAEGLVWTMSYLTPQSPIGFSLVRRQSADVFTALVVEKLPESPVVSAPKSEQLEIEGSCKDRTYVIDTTSDYAGEWRSGAIVGGAVNADRELIRVEEGTAVERAFALACGAKS